MSYDDDDDDPFAFNAGVEIRDTEFSNLVILSYIGSSKKSIKTSYY